MRWGCVALCLAVLAASACQRGEPLSEEAPPVSEEAQARREQALLIVEDALAVLRRGDIAGAIARLEEAQRADPDNHRVRHGLGLAHHQAGDFAAARDHHRAALEAAPDAVVYQTDLAHALYRLGAAEEARAALARALELEPRQARAHVLAAALARDEGDAPGEAAALRQACALDPDATLACAELMRLYVVWDQAEAALEVLARALPAVGDRRAVELWYYAALAHQSRGRWREVADALGELLALRPGDPGATLQRAAALAELGDRDAARQALEALLAREDLEAAYREHAAALLGGLR